MTLTPSDVENKTFGTALRGYDLDEVDDFLDEVVATIRELQDRLAECKAAERASVLHSTPLPAPEFEPAASAASSADESAVGRVLILAQNAADRLLEDADREKERIIEEAQAENDSLRAERDAQKVEIEAEMSGLSEHVSGVRTKLSFLSGAVADLLDEMDEALDSAPVSDSGETEGSLDAGDDDQETSTYDLDDSDEEESDDDDSELDDDGSEDD